MKPKVVVIAGPTASRKDFFIDCACEDFKWRNRIKRFHANLQRHADWDSKSNGRRNGRDKTLFSRFCKT